MSLRNFLLITGPTTTLWRWISLTSRLARGINIAYDWGLEVSTLSEVYQRAIPRKIAQIDLLPNYEHKHQVLSQDDSNKGLHKMVVDITKFYINYLLSHGLPIDDAYVNMIQTNLLPDGFTVYQELQR